MKSQLSKPQFLSLTTHGWKSGKEHKIEIWFVEHNKRYYIISQRLDRAPRIHNIRQNATVSFKINGNVFKGSARIADQEKESGLAEEVFKFMNIKYKRSQGLIVETYANKFKVAQ